MKVKTEYSAGGIVTRKINGIDHWLIVENKTATRYWGFPKGHIGDKISNEKAEEAALREVSEEGGITAKLTSNTPIEVSYEFRNGDTLHKKYVTYFLMEYVSGDTKNHDHEVADAKFVPKRDLLEQLTFENDKNAFKNAQTIR